MSVYHRIPTNEIMKGVPGESITILFANGKEKVISCNENHEWVMTLNGERIIINENAYQSQIGELLLSVAKNFERVVQFDPQDPRITHVTFIESQY